MFRQMRRFKQQVSEAECVEILKTEKRGVLSLIGENGYPYGIPINHFYDETDGKIYFHGAKQGHKIDALEKCDRACYTVYDGGYLKPDDWALNIKSVIVFGKVSKVNDIQKAEKICRALCSKFTSDSDYVEKEVASALSRVQCLEMTVEYMTGKEVNEK
jgi:nitroimidazol reductase NimA-like FMN-containing flavoprotein (pyridoxamine 5'-phosphate oxidase superfamily)